MIEIGIQEQAIANAEALKLDLTKQLLLSQREAERNVLKFQHLAKRSDVVIFIIIKSDGVYSYRNEAWYNILDPIIDRNIDLGDAWSALIDNEYIPVGQVRF